MTNLETRTALEGVARAIVTGTIAVALLDAADGVAFFGLTLHMNPLAVLQYIASGAFGRSSFDGGLATAFAGLAFHVVISTLSTAAFVGAYLWLPAVRRNAIAAGLVFGALVWLVMNQVVLPHSAVVPTPVNALTVVHGLLGHAFFVGLPAALASRRYIRTSR